MSIDQPRKPAGTPVGGQFGNRLGSAPSGSLKPPTKKDQPLSEVDEFLARVGGGDAPGSRYGRSPNLWGPVALAYSKSLMDSGIDQEAAEDAAVRAVVNDSSEVANDLRWSEHGADVYDPDWLDDDTAAAEMVDWVDDDWLEEGFDLDEATVLMSAGIELPLAMDYAEDGTGDVESMIARFRAGNLPPHNV